MNIPIQTGEPALSDFVFRAADRMRIDGCANAVAREGLSLALYCPFEALLDHYTGLLLNRLRQQAPEHRIEVYFPANTDALLNRFNEVLASQSVNQATKTPLTAGQAQIWLVHDAQKLPEAEIQLLARLIQNFPGANIRAILLMSGTEAAKYPLPTFGRKILRWDIEAPSEEQAQATLALAQNEGYATAVQQLLQRIQRRPGDTLTVSSLVPPVSDTAPSSPTPAAKPARTTQRLAAFHQRGQTGLKAVWQKAKALGQTPVWIRKNAKLSIGIASAMLASTLLMLWLQPEAFGLKSLKSGAAQPVKTLPLPAPSNANAVVTATAQAASEPAIEVPEAAMQGQTWVRSLAPNSYLVQYGNANTYEKIIAIQRKYPELKPSQIVAAYRPGEKLAHFVIVTGPYNTTAQGNDFLKRPSAPAGSWLRSTRSLQEQLKAPTSAMDTLR